LSLACTACMIRKTKVQGKATFTQGFLGKIILQCDFVTADVNVCMPCRAAGNRCNVAREDHHKDCRKGYVSTKCVRHEEHTILIFFRDDAQLDIVGIRECLRTLESMLRQPSNDQSQRDSEEDPPNGTENSNREDRRSKAQGRGSGNLSSSRQETLALSWSDKLPTAAPSQLVVAPHAPEAVVQLSPMLDT